MSVAIFERCLALEGLTAAEIAVLMRCATVEEGQVRLLVWPGSIVLLRFVNWRYGVLL